MANAHHKLGHALSLVVAIFVAVLFWKACQQAELTKPLSLIVTYFAALLTYVAFHVRKLRVPAEYFAKPSDLETVCSNVSAFLSLSVIASFLVLPSTTYVYMLGTGSQTRWWLWIKLGFVASAAPIALCWVAQLSRREHRHRESRGRGRGFRTYLFDVDKAMGARAAQWVFFLMVLFTAAAIVGEVAMFRLVYDELLADSLGIHPCVIGAIAILFCSLYVTRGGYSAVLSTDVFQAGCLLLVLIVLLGLGLCHSYNSSDAAFDFRAEQTFVLFDASQPYVNRIQSSVQAMPQGWRSCLHAAALAGAFLLMLAWFLVSPSAWVLNVSTRVRDKGPPPKRWPLWVSGVLLCCLLVGVSWVGKNTVYTVLHALPAYRPERVAEWHHAGQSEALHTSRAFEAIAEALGHGPENLLPGALLVVGVLLCFQTTLDTNVIALAQMAKELECFKFLEHPPVDTRNLMPRFVRKFIQKFILSFQRNLIPYFTTGVIVVLPWLVTVRSDFIHLMVRCAGVAMFAIVLLFLTVMLAFAKSSDAQGRLNAADVDGWWKWLPRWLHKPRQRCLGQHVDGRMLFCATVGAVVCALIATRINPGGLQRGEILGLKPTFVGVDRSWLLYAASSITCLCAGFSGTTLAFVVYRKCVFWWRRRNRSATHG